MSLPLPRAIRPAVGDQLRTPGLAEPLPVVATLGQWVTVMHPERGQVRLHASDDRIPGRLDAWRVDGIQLEVAP